MMIIKKGLQSSMLYSLRFRYTRSWERVTAHFPSKFYLLSKLCCRLLTYLEETHPHQAQHLKTQPIKKQRTLTTWTVWKMRFFCYVTFFIVCYVMMRLVRAQASNGPHAKTRTNKQTNKTKKRNRNSELKAKIFEDSSFIAFSNSPSP